MAIKPVNANRATAEEIFNGNGVVASFNSCIIEHLSLRVYATMFT